MIRRLDLRFALAGLAGILILASGCMDQSPTALEPSASGEMQAALPGSFRAVHATIGFAAGTTTATINPSGGSIDFGIGSITFPKGAVSHATTISATVDGTTVGVAFAPHGLTFPAGAQPTLTFDVGTVDVPVGASVLYVDDDGNVLENLGGDFDALAQSVKVQLRHFSPYILGAN